MQLFLQLSAPLFKLLSCILLASRGSLKLGQIFSLRQLIFQPSKMMLYLRKFILNLVKNDSPLLFKVIVFLQTSPHLSFIFSIVVCDLRFSLLVYFNLKATFTRPLLSQVLVQLFNTLVLELFAFSLALCVIYFLLLNQPIRDSF